MTVHFYTSASLDGFLATEDHSLAWLFAQEFDTEGPMAYPAFIEGVGALAMGASTYRWLLDQGGSWPYTQPTWAFTHQELAVPEGAAVRFVSGSPADSFDRICASSDGKDLWVVGGGGLASQLAEAGLLDEVWVQLAPVTLGTGPRCSRARCSSICSGSSATVISSARATGCGRPEGSRCGIGMVHEPDSTCVWRNRAIVGKTSRLLYQFDDSFFKTHATCTSFQRISK